MVGEDKALSVSGGAFLMLNLGRCVIDSLDLEVGCLFNTDFRILQVSHHVLPNPHHFGSEQEHAIKYYFLLSPRREIQNLCAASSTSTTASICSVRRVTAPVRRHTFLTIGLAFVNKKPGCSMYGYTDIKTISIPCF